MRKIGLLLMPVLFLLALGCGGGGQGTTSGGSTGDTTGVTPGIPSGYGVIALTFNKTDTAAPDTAGPAPRFPVVIPPSTLPAATHARVAVRMVKTEQLPAYDENDVPIPGEFYTITHEIYRLIEDYDLSAVTTASLHVPAADGYTVEVVSYYNNLDNTHNLLKYGKSSSPVNVISGETNSSVVLNPNQIATGLNIALPDNVIAGSQYSLSVNTEGLPLHNQYYFQQFVDNSTNFAPTSNFTTTSSPLFQNVNAIFVAQSLTYTDATNTYWDLYFQGMFFIRDTWLKDAALGSKITEAKTDWKKWKFYYPNLDYPTKDEVSGMKTKLWPLGTISIDVNL
jgi:hypothetical protein